MEEYDKYSGKYTIIVRDKKTKEVVDIINGKNIITYKGADIFARCTGGGSEYFPNRIYGEHAASGTYTEGVLPGLPLSRLDTVDNPMRQSPRSTTDAEEEFLMAPTFTSSNASLYNYNTVTFTASFSGPGLTNRTFVGIGIVTYVASQEILVAHSYFPAKTLASGQEMLVHWSIQFA